MGMVVVVRTDKSAGGYSEEVRVGQMAVASEADLAVGGAVEEDLEMAVEVGGLAAFGQAAVVRRESLEAVSTAEAKAVALAVGLVVASAVGWVVVGDWAVEEN